MLIVFQTLFVLFSLYALYSVYRRYKEHLLGSRGFIFWVLFWLAVAVVIIWPETSQVLADHIGIGRGADLILYISIVTIFFVLFRLHIKLEGLKRDITRVVREKALKK